MGASKKDYIKDGLSLWLAGEDATDSEWVDRVHGYTYTLSDFVAIGNGISAIGNSAIGILTGGISITPATGTLEVVVNDTNSSKSSCTVFFLGRDRIGLGFYDNATYCTSGNTNYPYYEPLRDVTGIKTVAINDAICMCNLSQIQPLGSGKVTSTASANSLIGSPISRYIGQRFFYGTIYQIRVYNRKLTSEEIVHNQNIDIDKYNITT